MVCVSMQSALGCLRLCLSDGLTDNCLAPLCAYGQKCVMTPLSLCSDDDAHHALLTLALSQALVLEESLVTLGGSNC